MQPLGGEYALPKMSMECTQLLSGLAASNPLIENQNLEGFTVQCGTYGFVRLLAQARLQQWNPWCSLLFCRFIVYHY